MRQLRFVQAYKPTEQENKAVFICVELAENRFSQTVVRLECVNKAALHLSVHQKAADARNGRGLRAVGFHFAAVRYHAVDKRVRGVGVGHAEGFNLGAESFFFAQKISHAFSPPISA